MIMWDDWESNKDSKMRVHFNITNLGETTTYSADLDYETPWTEVLDKLVRTLEAHYGYSSDLEELGVYYSGKQDD